MKYELIQSDDLDEFNDKINHLLKKGFECHGFTMAVVQDIYIDRTYRHPSSSRYNDKIGQKVVYLQAMINME